MVNLESEPIVCQVKDALVSQLVGLNNKLNLLSPQLVHSDLEKAEVQRQREDLSKEIKRHNATGHAGRPCPAARTARRRAL